MTATAAAAATRRDAGGAPLDETRIGGPLVQAFFARAARHPDVEALLVYPRGATAPGGSLTWGAWAHAARGLAAHLVVGGVAPGERVAILAGNRPVWPIADLAVQAIGAIGVGVYPSSAPAQIDELLADCDARVLITDDVDTAARLAHAGSRLAFLLLDVPDTAQERAAPVLNQPMVYDFAHCCAQGAERLVAEPALAALVQARLEAVQLDDLAALIYTSGSTGAPKGAAISHRYLAASAATIAQVLGLSAADRGLSFLPYSHAAERVFGQATRLRVGMAAALIEDPTDLFAVAAQYEPTLFGGLPRLFERLYEAAELAARRGDDPRAAIRSRLGAQVRVATSGGAALPAAVAERLDALGLPILGAYGQTEHLCVAMNRPDRPRADSVGTPMPGTQLRVADDGELLVARSALTFSGYWRRDTDTAAAFTPDGAWLRTGDLAEIDADGTLRITGRVKELLALSTGRKVAPVPVEAALTASPFIAHAVLHGEGRKYVTALLALRRAVVEQWAAEQGIATPWPALTHETALQQQLAAVVDAVNEPLARTDRIQRFAVTADEFTEANGLLTSTLKVRRRVVDDRYRLLFDTLYATGGSP